MALGGFHAHIYFDADQIELARILPSGRMRFWVAPSGMSTPIRSGLIHEDRASFRFGRSSSPNLPSGRPKREGI